MPVWMLTSKPQGSVANTSAKGNIYVGLIKGKGLPQPAEVSQGVPGSLRTRIFLMFGTRRVAGPQLYAPAAFTPEEIPGTHF
jgi:hypothetical protein